MTPIQESIKAFVIGTVNALNNAKEKPCNH